MAGKEPNTTPSLKKESKNKPFTPTQRQFLALYRLGQFGFARRQHLERACFRDVSDARHKFSEHIVPIIKGGGYKSVAPDLILQHEDTQLLYLGKKGRDLLEIAEASSAREAFAEEQDELEPRYYRGRDHRDAPIRYNVPAVPRERRVAQNARLDEYFGIADVFARFVECEGGVIRTRDDEYTIERVEVYCKPADVVYHFEGKKQQVKPDGLVILYRRDRAGALSFDWFYLEYEETSTPAKKLDTLKQYAQFYWSGAFSQVWNNAYRYAYGLHEVNDGRPVENPRMKVLVVVEDSDGSGYLDGILADFRFLKDVGLNYQDFGFPSDMMGLGQFLFARRSELVKGEHALEPMWLNGANYQRKLAGEDWRLVSCLG